MNYKKIYIKLMRKGLNRQLPKEVCVEKHHIFPKSIFGKNKSIVILTAREHFIAHLLLWKYYQKKYGNKNEKTKKMLNAVWWMRHTDNKQINSKIYETLKINKAIIMSESMSGENNPMKKEENRIKMSGENHYLNKDPIKKEEHKIRMSGENNPYYGKIGENSPFFGQKHSEETKNKLKVAQKKYMKKVERVDPETR